MQPAYLLTGTALLVLAVACNGETENGATVGGGTTGNGGSSSGASGGASGGSGPIHSGGSGGFIDLGDAGCPRTTCAELGWACGYTVDVCGNVVDCEEEGLTCGPNQVCVGGIDGPTVCAAGADPNCQLCTAVPDCGSGAQLTRLTGRVITPGRDDANVANQVRVPNALVYIMKTDQLADLPPIPTGIPADGQSCDRCEDQDLGPFLAGAVTDAEGNFVIEGNVPVGVEFLLVVKAGKFRRVVRHTLPESAACQTTALPTELPGNPTRLPRSISDGDAVNIPKIAISTGRIDAMECMFAKMGLASSGAASEFTRPQLGGRIHLYRADGAWPDAAAFACNACGTSTSQTDQDCRTDNCGGPDNSARTSFLDAISDASIYGSVDAMNAYDMVVFDCEGQGWDQSGTQRGTGADGTPGGNVRQYANRGGRMFLSHLSFSWLYQNGTTAYDAAAPIATGLGQVERGWDTAYTADGNLDDTGTGVVSLVPPAPPAPPRQTSPRIQTFADWMVSESVTSAPGYTFTITDPRSLNTSLAPLDEEFVYRSGGNNRTQQFSFNTPYGAPDEAACGRVAYSGFHVAATGDSTNPFQNATFPAHCTGDLTPQEKVLLYMLFDLGACVGDEPVPPPCVPITCDGVSGRRCGFTPDGCGEVLDCGPCRPPA